MLKLVEHAYLYCQVIDVGPESGSVALFCHISESINVTSIETKSKFGYITEACQ